jgi:OOP family OmpA-OmpF porin
VTDTLLAPLSSSVMRNTMEELANQLGESLKSVSRGMELSAAAVFGGLTRKAGDPVALQQVIEQAVRTPANAVMAGVSDHQLTDPSSPVISGSSRFLSALFGGGQTRILDSIARESGLKASAAGSILALGTQWVLSFIGTRVRDDGMTASSLAGVLRSEGPSLRKALPAELIDDLTPVAAPISSGMSYLTWLLPLAAVLAVVLWLANRPESVMIREAPVISEITMPALGTIVPRRLSDGVTINIPQRGVEGKLLAFIENSTLAVNTTTWFDFDRLLFDFGSATLQPQSRAQLGSVAAILRAHPQVHLKIGGYTDNVGPHDDNIQLSQARATHVRDELVLLGVAPDRLVAEGYGEQYPVADNSTETGRAMNRRISMLVTQK